MMHVRRGFTIIELMITVAIITLLTGLAIPLYANFNKRQNFAASVQDVIDCLRVAQQKAATQDATSTTSVRYTSATITIRSDGTLACAANSHERLTSTGAVFNPVTAYAALGTAIDAVSATTTSRSAITIGSVTGNTTTTSVTTQMKIFFGSLEKGAPVVLWTDASATPIYVAGNPGFTTTINVSQPGTSATGIIRINSLGSPIAYDPS